MASDAAFPIPGKILIVDDKFETVEDAASFLLKQGYPVLFWNGDSDPPSTVQNIRGVILDLDFTGDQIHGGEGYYALAAESLHKIPGPHITVVMSGDFNAEDPAKLRQAYQEMYSDRPVMIHDRGLSKLEFDENPEKLVGLVVDSLQTQDIMSLVLSWESILDGSKDAILQDFVKAELESAFLRLIHSILEEQGEHGTPRGFVDTLTRLLSRKMVSSSELDRIAESLKKVLKRPSTPPQAEELDNLLHWLLMYYYPDDGEEPRTGDIYEVLDSKEYVYGIVLTPICDLVQEKAQSIMICTGYELGDRCFNDTDSPLLTCDPAMAKKKTSPGVTPESLSTHMKNRYHGKDTKLYDGLHCLWNFRMKPTEASYTGVCFDLKNVRSYSMEEFDKFKWKRVCRLDSPFIDVMLQKYGVNSSRIGAPDINRNPEYLAALAAKSHEAETVASPTPIVAPSPTVPPEGTSSR